MSDKVVTFGEIMMRLATPGFQRIVQAREFEVTYCGGEANVAASLANFGMDAYFVSKVPDGPVGQACINFCRQYGIKTDYMLKGGSRLGLYYLEAGASQRASKVIYDRKGSAIAEARYEEFPWDDIFKGAAVFHVTGITPAISDLAADATLKAVQKAKDMGLTVCCDINFRKKLWSKEKAREVMSNIFKYVDIAIGNEEDTENVFGIKAGRSDVTSGQIDEEGYCNVARELMEKFGLSKVAITLRESYSASDNGWSALLYDGKDFCFSKKYNIHIVDRVGGGDSFAGALIYALLKGYDSQKAVDFAVAASCLKHTIPGDFNLVTLDEVENLLSGDGSGRVQR